MATHPISGGDYLAAVLSGEFATPGEGRNAAVECIHRAIFDEWVHAVQRTDLFTHHEVARAVRTWQEDPHSLLETLLTDADEPTVRQCEIAWGRLKGAAYFDYTLPGSGWRRHPAAV